MEHLRNVENDRNINSPQNAFSGARAQYPLRKHSSNSGSGKQKVTSLKI